MLTYDFGGSEWTIDKEPGTCPLCHHAIDPRFLVGLVQESNSFSSYSLEIVFQCPRESCRHAFIGRYFGQHVMAGDVICYLRATTPYTPIPPVHPDLVAALSPQFVTIFEQAAAGEKWGLNEIAGCGYRKSLEFLIKDYCISRDRDNAEFVTAVKTKMLGVVIAEYIEDTNIKECARRAAWLGNDETHYERRWSAKDIRDLKALIALTVSWVNAHLLTKQYLDEMPA